MRSHLYLIMSSFRRMRDHPRLHLLAVFTVTICFMLVGTGLMGFYHIKRSLTQTKHLQWVYIYMDAPLKDFEQSNFKDRYCSMPWVDMCKYVNPTQAKSIFLSQYADMKDSLEALGENPFPASFEIRLKQKITEKETLQKWLDELKKLDRVAQVDDGGEWLSQWIDLILFLDSMTYVILILVGLMIIGLISNTIKLLMFSKKDEIGILQLVGATPSMIRTPLLINAALYGLLGSLMALFLLFLGYLQLNKYVLQNFSALLSESISFMSPIDQILMVIIAITVSVVGAWFSIGRYLSHRDIS